MNWTTFGESHGPAMGVVVEGFPAGVVWNPELLKSNMARRRPGQSPWVTARNESDEVEVLSGVFEDRTLGTPIAMIVRNQDARPEDYKSIDPGARIGHADELWLKKYGHADLRGGGRASGRETVSRVMAGSVAQMFVQSLYPNLKIVAWTAQVGEVELDEDDMLAIEADLLDKNYFVDGFAGRMPHQFKSELVKDLLVLAKEEGRSYGGRAKVWLEGVPQGLGRPVDQKLKSDMAQALMSIGAVTGVELGAGFASARAEGTQFHHPGTPEVYGGIRGGISTGERISWSIAFKPTSSVMDVAKKGRHDPCIVPRAIPVIEAVLWGVVAEHVLLARTDRA